jgi:hypothetical protein
VRLLAGILLRYEDFRPGTWSDEEFSEILASSNTANTVSD